MDPKILASFNVTITSAENASWQGYVEADGQTYEFQSELQLLLRILERYPDLHPKAPQDES